MDFQRAMLAKVGKNTTNKRNQKDTPTPKHKQKQTKIQKQHNKQQQNSLWWTKKSNFARFNVTFSSTWKNPDIGSSRKKAEARVLFAIGPQNIHV